MQRRIDIDMAKGLAILLVVFGHLVARGDPVGVHWYEPLRRAIYSFHMPFFLYLSGLTAVLSGTALAPRTAWRRIAAARARRLLLPFFGLGLLILFGKLALCRLIFVDHAPSGLAAGLDGLFWHTAASPALSVWYLIVLFTVSLAAMAVLNGVPGRLAPLAACALALYAVPLPALLYLDRIGTYAIFFLLGAAAAMAARKYEPAMDRFWPLLLALFLTGLALDAALGAAWPPKAAMLALGALSMPALHGTLRSLAPNPPRAFLLLGRYSFMIYLFNTLFIGLLKGALLPFWSWNGAHFLPFATLLMAAGTLGPILLKRHIFRYSLTLDRLTD